VLRAAPIGEDGRPLALRETEKFRTAAYDHTLAPRDAEVVRYRFDAPRTLDASALPLAVTARLRHRTRNEQLHALTCAESKTPRGKQFAAAVRERTGAASDACTPQPITEIAESTIAIGGDAIAPDARAWQRLFDHALGLLHALQEQLGEARPSLDRAFALLPANAERERAMVMSLYGALAVREGRTEEALAWLDRADALVPGHAAIGRLRGEAFGGVWRFEDALAPLRASATAAAGDDSAWTRLAVAYGSAGSSTDALAAAQRGLALQPRDADLLRVQSLALDALGASASLANDARAAFLAFRAPDDAQSLRALCSDRVPGCALERIPVHVHALRSPRADARPQ
jgi:tetratricopeptide (TPR) repeat protein